MAVRRGKTKTGAAPDTGEAIRNDHMDDSRARIALRAYELYEQRGRMDGNDVADWLQAEAEIQAGVIPMRAAR